MRLQSVLHVNFVGKLFETAEVAIQHNTLALHGKNFGSFTSNEPLHRLLELWVYLLGWRVLHIFDEL